MNTCKFLRYIFAWEKISFNSVFGFEHDDKRNFIRRSFTAFDRLFDDCSLIVFVDRCSILVLKLRGYGSDGFV